MRTSIAFLILVIMLTACSTGKPNHEQEESIAECTDPSVEKMVFQFFHSFTSPSMLIWDARENEIIFQNMSRGYSYINLNEADPDNSIFNLNYKPLSLYCKIDSVSATYLRDSIKLDKTDLKDNVVDMNDGMISCLFVLYDDGQYFDVEFNWPTKNQASIAYLLLEIAQRNQPDFLSNEYLQYIQEYFKPKER